MSGETRSLAVDGIFVNIGVVPNTELFAQELPLAEGRIRAGEDCRTDIPGVFAAGDVREKEIRQPPTARPPRSSPENTSNRSNAQTAAKQACQDKGGNNMVKVYSINECPWCDKVKKYLKSKQIDFEVHNIEENDDDRLACEKLTGDTLVPIITANDKDYVLGFDKAKIDALLAS